MSAQQQAAAAATQTGQQASAPTVRDCFAAAALQGLISYYGDRLHIVDADGRASLHAAAFEHADRMLEARGA